MLKVLKRLLLGAKLMKKFLYILGFLWALPLSLPVWILGLFLLATKQIERFHVTEKFEFVWDLEDDGYFFKGAFEKRDFWGFSFGNNIFIKDRDDKRYKRGIKHESRHCFQSYYLGIAFPLIYILEALIIYFFVKEEHSYYDNWFEIDARKYAGQLLNIPKSAWKNDRWIFW